MTLMSSFAKIITEIPFNRTLGLTLDHVEENQISMSFHYHEELIGNYLHGILHGGVISSVLDMAGGTAVMVALALKHPHYDLEQLSHMLGKCSTINLHIDYLRPGKGDHFKATATVLRSGSKISVAHMQLINDESTLIATGAGTYLVS